MGRTKQGGASRAGRAGTFPLRRLRLGPFDLAAQLFDVAREVAGQIQGAEIVSELLNILRQAIQATQLDHEIVELIGRSVDLAKCILNLAEDVPRALHHLDAIEIDFRLGHNRCSGAVVGCRHWLYLSLGHPLQGPPVFQSLRAAEDRLSARRAAAWTPRSLMSVA